ncbi:MAG TPA: extracellular solute-binding protein [Candidatus Limnocylindrales bacterium]|nr:extracellular solute-binding protein [Candidatus Limnocylindrales bacterium]
MRAKFLMLVVATVLVFAACSSGSTSPAPSSGGGGGSSPGATEPATSPGGSAAPSGSAASGTLDPASVSGSVVISGWRSSPEEGEALTQTLLGFPAVYPNIHVDYQPIAGDYPTVMVTKISSHEPPDLFYVNADYTPEWIAQGFLLPLDDYIAKLGIDTSQFFDGYLSIFKGKDGKIYGLPKDGNTIALASNTDIVATAPTTMDQLVTTAQGLVGKNGLKAPMCLNPSLDRGLAFIYAQGGSLLNADKTAEAIDTDASKAAVQWYLDLFKNGLGMTAAQLGDGWCGDALGKGHVAMIFEGGWLDPAMVGTYPKVKYAWSEMPTGSSGKPVTLSFTVSYSIGTDSANKDQAAVLLDYLTGKEGMTTWTEGGVALPSRKDVAAPAGKDVLVKGSDYAQPGSGFMPGYVDVQKAFQDAFTAQVTKKTYDAGPVVTATAAAITKALAQ